MKFMFSWKILPAFHRAAALGFLNSGAPMPEGLKCIGRWHAPGSAYGWLLCETNDPAVVYEHAAQWGEFLEIQVMPVVEDEVAGEALKKIYGS